MEPSGPSLSHSALTAFTLFVYKPQATDCLITVSLRTTPALRVTALEKAGFPRQVSCTNRLHTSEVSGLLSHGNTVRSLLSYLYEWKYISCVTPPSPA